VNRNSSSGGCSVAGARQAGAMTVLLVAVGIVLGLTRRRRRR
jgi:MYXO-CTERM domain-containing protein